MVAPNAHDRDDRPAEEADLSARLQRLGEKLDRHRESITPGDASAPRSGPRFAGFARGFRLSSELVAGVIVGAVIGWSLDHWLGISPWGMIIFLLVGFAAGVVNVMRAAGVVPDPGAKDRDA
ncbi:MAG: AtpZ/AtpI family protein [Rhodoplanes sp.]|nr:AtpZ/AtpI family protein [Rhodoplanes sp.]